MDVLDRIKDDGRPPGVPPRPFQFTLRTMFIVTTVVAVVCSLLIACPPAVRIVSGACLPAHLSGGLRRRGNLRPRLRADVRASADPRDHRHVPACWRFPNGHRMPR